MWTLAGGGGGAVFSVASKIGMMCHWVKVNCAKSDETRLRQKLGCGLL